MITAIQQQIITRMIQHFETINQRPCSHTVKIMTEAFGFIMGGEFKTAVNYMMDGKSTGGGFRYDHPQAYRKFYAAFWQQWNARKGVQ